MNILFLTQSNTLSLFYDILKEFKNMTDVGMAGFYIADSRYYNTFIKEQPSILSENLELLKEWDICREAEDINPDIVKLREIEKRLGDPVLWNALIADRRTYCGKRTTFKQDYASHLDHDKMLAVLQTGLSKMEKTFDKIKPDLVIGFICVTFGEYLAYLIAKSRSIQFLNLRPTRIKNYFYAGEDVHEPSDHLEEVYRGISSGVASGDSMKAVTAYLEEIRSTHAMYEGVIPPPVNSAKVAGKTLTRKIVSAAKTIPTKFKSYYDYNHGDFRFDNHYTGTFAPIWFKRMEKPLRIKHINGYLKNIYINKKSLSSINYTFYPLHKEPEVTLLVYSRPYMNQIEVIRNIARSLPVGMKLIVKEHPAAIGYRKRSYYRKIISIPNVLLAAPEITSRDLINNADMISIISGSIGLEALMMKKPVIHFGNVPFSFLPDSMIRHINNPEKLGIVIHDLLENHKHDEPSLTSYLAAVMEESVPVDFYTRLLGRTGAYNPTLNGDNKETEERERIVHLKRLAKYLLDRAKPRREYNVPSKLSSEESS